MSFDETGLVKLLAYLVSGSIGQPSLGEIYSLISGKLTV